MRWWCWWNTATTVGITTPSRPPWLVEVPVWWAAQPLNPLLPLAAPPAPFCPWVFDLPCQPEAGLITWCVRCCLGGVVVCWLCSHAGLAALHLLICCAGLLLPPQGRACRSRSRQTGRCPQTSTSGSAWHRCDSKPPTLPSTTKLLRCMAVQLPMGERGPGAGRLARATAAAWQGTREPNHTRLCASIGVAASAKNTAAITVRSFGVLPA